MSIGSAAEGFSTAPPGARFPRSTAIPPSGLNGWANGKITSVLKFFASLLFSPIVFPVTVRASRCSLCLISEITAGMPPA